MRIIFARGQIAVGAGCALKGEAARRIGERRRFHRVDQSLCRSRIAAHVRRSEEHTSELQSLMRISYAVFCLKKKKIPQVCTHRTEARLTHQQMSATHKTN